MRSISVSQLQKDISRELKELPFIIKRYDTPIAKVVAPNFGEVVEGDKVNTEEVLTELANLGINYYRENPDKITPATLVNAIKELEKLKSADEYERALIEATGEEFKEDDGRPNHDQKLADGKN